MCQQNFKDFFFFVDFFLLFVYNSIILEGKMTQIQQIGERIKQLRIKNNLTQQQLADKLHYKSRSTINKIELGINEIHPTKIYAFAKALNTTPEYILGWKKHPEIYDNKVVITLADGSILNFSFDNEEIKKVIKYLNELEDNKE